MSTLIKLGERLMFGHIGLVYEINSKLENKMKEQVQIDPATLEHWEQTDNELVSSIVRELAKYLYPSPIVEVLGKATAGDQYFKVDVIMTFPGLPERKIAFQCKTHKEQAEDFVIKYANGVTYKGQVYLCPGVYYNDAKSIAEVFTFKQLRALGDFVGAQIHPEIIEGVQLLKRLKSVAYTDKVYTYLPYRQFWGLLKPNVWTTLQRFKVVTIGGGRIILNARL